MKRFFNFLLLILFIESLPLISQVPVYHSNQQWFQYTNQISMGPKLVLVSDASVRLNSHFASLTALTLRTGISYSIGKNIQGMSGMANFLTYQKEHPSRMEIRLFQDFQHTKKWKILTLRNRFRTEARYFKTIEEEEILPGSNFNFRFRYRLLAEFFISNLSSKNPDRKLFLSIGEEVFINSGNKILYNVFDNNRLLIGPGVVVSKSIQLNATYVYQIGHRAAPDIFDHVDILWFSMTHKLSRKQK